MTGLDGFLYGLLGGVFAELLGLFQLRRQAKGERPEYLISGFYWIITLLMSLAGGGLVLVYLRSGVDLKPIIAVNIGASAPLLIGAFVTQTPRVDPPRIDPGGTVS